MRRALQGLFGNGGRTGAGGPKVSVIVPVYNGADYVAEALASAKAQTYDNLEIIVVDDGSTDDTPAIIARSVGGDPRAKVLRQPNGGVASALNAGIRAATGDFICWLSHDDLFVPEKTSTQVARFAEIGDPCAILCSNYDLIDADGRLLDRVRLDGAMIAAKPEYAVLRGCVNGCTIFAPRDLFEAVGPFDESLPSTQDYDLWLRATDSRRFILMPESLVMTRQHPGQGSRQADYSAEFNDFWIRATDHINAERAAQLEGSLYRFLSEMARFLKRAGAAAATIHAGSRATEAARRDPGSVMVSVVIPFHSGVDLLRAAVYSALGQTHRNLEVIVVHDVPETDPSASLPTGVEGTPAVRVFCQHAKGAGMARNFGKRQARGDYIAFLDADDLYLPTKLETQLAHMLRQDAAISHTSYFTHGESGRMSSGYQNSGTTSGKVFPAIISHNPVAMPTVMIRRDVADAVDFPDAPGCEDFLWLLEVVQQHKLLGITEPLTVVRISPDSVAYDPVKQSRSLRAVAARLRADERFNRHGGHIDRLNALAADLEARIAG